ncbi:MAG: ABC transporter ATP-binding protein [Silicimonas sp.]|nr:ABC transporter ATP-binding protein [Silicimonas sp.]NNL73088.1 ABC transporter ATP-binding protein [Silicimonas sp.]
MSLLATRGLSKSFGGLDAVRGVDLTLKPGRIRALIGPNGAGKTTLVGMLCGRIEPSTGTVTFQEEDITRLPAHARIARGMAYTFQITSVFARLPVIENVALAARRKWPDAAEVDRRAGEALARVGLADRADQRAGDLAYGHQRLLEVAMGLVQDPKLLIMDEPTQGLSDAEIETFKSLVRDVAQAATVLLIEHNMRVVMELADRITVLNFGEVLAEGTPDEIHANADVQTAYLGTS